jgi:hypothetical protein
VRTELGRTLPLLVLFLGGLGAGVWIFASPWVLGYPTPSGWTPSVWTCVGVGGGLVLASGASLVTLLARATHLALREPAAGGRA